MALANLTPIRERELPIALPANAPSVRIFVCCSSGLKGWPLPDIEGVR